MIDLDLLSFQNALRFKRENDKRWLFDPIRKKWLVVQPEELVRQLIIQYLISVKNYNQNRINVERGLRVNDLYKRCDILVYNKELQPLLLVECKAPEVAIDQKVFKQIAWYNMPLKVKYLMVSNGIDTYCCSMDYDNRTYEFMEEVPEFEKIS